MTMRKSTYLRELDEQVRLKKEREAAERERERVLDAKIEQQFRQANRFPWDSGRTVSYILSEL